MIVVMKPHATQADIAAMVARVESLNLKPHVIEGTHRTIIAGIGEEPETAQQALEGGDGVENVMRILAPYKLASRELKPENTVVRARNFECGGKSIGVIAGPCSVESEEGIIAAAKAVLAAGATALRGGAYKPRTSPYSFQGHKEDGLKMLAAARDATGLAIVTEVLTSEHVPLVAKYADVLQIGARNMQNYVLLEAAGKAGLPVLLKRGPAAKMDEFLLAAEYILDAGCKDVMLCERGIRTFESHTRFTLPLASVVYLHEKTHLPVIIDPSHGTGHASMVPRMSAAAVAAGADGLIIEVHPEPENAMSDGYQTLSPEQFAETMAMCRKVAEAVGREIPEPVGV
ncbi:MAG TPA: 3-deoxy-7-phosphoheptulonate synthase [Pirellulales bacterium]